MTAHFEYRIFAPSLPPSIDEFVCEEGEPVASEEIYILPRRTEKLNAKIRDRQLETKQLVERTHGLERWQPAQALDFPVARDSLDDVLGLMRVTAPALLHVSYSISRFLHEVVVPSNELDFCKVAKRRRKAQVAGCAAEKVEVVIAGMWHADSLALEHEDARALLAALDQTGLRAWPNQNYPAAIRQFMGMPTSKEEQRLAQAI